MVLRQRQRRLGSLIEAIERLLEQPLDDCAHLFVAVDVVAHCVIAGLLDEPGGTLLRKSDNAPHRALSDAAFGVEQVLTERLRLRSDVAGACQQEGGLTGG